MIFYLEKTEGFFILVIFQISLSFFLILGIKQKHLFFVTKENERTTNRKNSSEN